MSFGTLGVIGSHPWIIHWATSLSPDLSVWYWGSLKTRVLKRASSLRALAEASTGVIIDVDITDFPQIIQALSPFLKGDQIVFHTLRHLFPQTPSQYIKAHTPVLKIGALLGPAIWHAPLSNVQNHPNALWMASHYRQAMDWLKNFFPNPWLRQFYSKDLEGSERASAAARVYAWASGLAQGLELGPATQAFLATQVSTELRNFIRTFQGQDRISSNLPGLGEWILHLQTQSPEYLLGLKWEPALASSDLALQLKAILRPMLRPSLPLARALVQILEREMGPLKALRNLMGIRDVGDSP